MNFTRVLWGHLPYKDSRADQHTSVLLRSPSTQFHTHSISSYCPHDSYSGRRRRYFNCFPCTHFLSVPLCQCLETRRGRKIPWGSPGRQGREDCRKRNAQHYKYIYGKNVCFLKKAISCSVKRSLIYIDIHIVHIILMMRACDVDIWLLLGCK